MKVHALSTTAMACLLMPHGAGAQASSDAPAQQVVVTATRVARPAFDVPASITLVDADTIHDGNPQINISESLGGVPGLLARDRQNYAQDVQISVRGFGARSAFGVRGVRIYVDGIPATLPDGQGQITNVDIASAGRIEVLRGPFSALYGNSSGGVIQVFTQDPSGPPGATAQVAAGSDGQRRYGAILSGTSGGLGLVVSGSRFMTDGYRDHSSATRDIENAKVTLRPDDATLLTLVGNRVALPLALDPLGLTRAEFDAAPRSVDSAATNFDTRKTYDQSQGGAILEHQWDAENSMRLMVYEGLRHTEQFQAIPVAPQANPLHPGGVIELGREYGGADARWTWRGAAFDVVGGLSYDALQEHRQGYQNFIGSELGVQGALRRDELNTVFDLDPYLQASWRFAPGWSLDAGVRRSRVSFDSKDAYIVGTNPDDSGRTSYSATLPVVSLMHAFNENLHVYASAGRGFETPTLNELAYRPNGLTGLNFDLQPSRSDNFELGLKARGATLGEFTAAVFAIRTHDEIVTQTNTGGRATYQNASATRRKGLELAWSRSFAGDLRAQLAWTLLDATYTQGFATCSKTPCPTPDLTIPAGNAIPGVARSTLDAKLGWEPDQGWRAGLEVDALSKVYVNDQNSDAAPAYTIASANVGYAIHEGTWSLTGFARLNNMFDRSYAGSVIVNEGNGRYFEPAPGRNWAAGLSASRSF